MTDTPQYGYGILNSNCLSFTVFSMTHKYCRYRMLPPNKLTYEEATRYSTARSKLHDEIAEALDIDRDLVDEAFEKATEFWNKIPEEMRDDKDFGMVWDSFCNKLEYYATLPAEKRHRVFDVEPLNPNDLKGVPSL